MHATIKQGIRKVMVGDKNALTTGQAAKLLGVASRTVTKWFDGGRLKGYKLPGSNDRRIPVDEFIEFIMRNGLPMPKGLMQGTLLFCDSSLAEQFDGTRCSDSFDVAMAMNGTRYSFAIVQDKDGLHIANKIRDNLLSLNNNCVIVMLVDPSQAIEESEKDTVAVYHTPCHAERIKAFFAKHQRA